MTRSKIIIVEGPQGVGKTTITDHIRNSIPYTNLYRLYGTSDATITGKTKSEHMYNSLMNYIETLKNMDVNLVFDRTFFSEEIYCRLGFKQYSFTDIYEKLLKELATLDFDIYYITLYLGDTSKYEERLSRKGKAKVKYAKFDIDSSVKQQNEYLKMADEIEKKYKTIKVIKYDTNKELEVIKNEISEMLTQ